MSDMLRITGISSGMDTDTMIKQLMKAEQSRVNKVKQEKQLVEWRQEIYRDVIDSIGSFKNNYFDYTKPDTNFRSTGTFDLFSTEVLLDGETTSKVDVTALSNASVGQVNLNSVTQLATADTWNSSSKVAGNITGTLDTIENVNQAITDGLTSFTLTLDGSSKTITLDGGYDPLNGYADLETDLNTKLAAAFPNVAITVSEAAGELEFSIAEEGHTLAIGGSTNDLLTSLGLESGDSNVIDDDQTLETAFGIDTDIAFTINGEAFSFTKDSTLENVINTVNNNAVADVTLRYSELTDKFTFTADDEGVGNDIALTDTDSFFTTHLKLDGGDRTNGQDAIFELNGVATTRSSNTFEVDGLKFELKETFAAIDGPIEINVASDPENVKDKVISFVNAYNEMITTINDLTHERRYYSFDPLTDEERDSLSESEIEQWESKAKSGLMRSDSMLEGITSQMRVAMYSQVEDLGISLEDLGITTSSVYEQQGLLIIDETELDTALTERPDEVISLFTRSSDIEYGDSDNKTQRFNESGLADRLYDIMEDYTRTSRDDDTDLKGLLLELAGTLEDTTESANQLSFKIDAYDNDIANMLDSLADKEDGYYRKFAAMEQALSKLNSQSSWLAQQFSSGG